MVLQESLKNSIWGNTKVITGDSDIENIRKPNFGKKQIFPFARCLVKLAILNFCVCVCVYGFFVSFFLITSAIHKGHSDFGT